MYAVCFLQKRLDFRCRQSVSVVMLMKPFGLIFRSRPASDTATVGPSVVTALVPSQPKDQQDVAPQQTQQDEGRVG
jgi:hypothetical protein